MPKVKEAASEFLANKRIGITGVSRTPEGHGSNLVYRRVRDRGYEVFAVNSNAAKVEGDACYPDLGSIPGGVDAVVIGTRARDRRDDHEGVRRPRHQALVDASLPSAGGSVSDASAAYGRARAIRVIDGGCPCMSDHTADSGHKAMRFVFTLTGIGPTSGQDPRRCADGGCLPTDGRWSV